MTFQYLLKNGRRESGLNREKDTFNFDFGNPEISLQTALIRVYCLVHVWNVGLTYSKI